MLLAYGEMGERRRSPHGEDLLLTADSATDGRRQACFRRLPSSKALPARTVPTPARMRGVEAEPVTGRSETGVTVLGAGVEGTTTVGSTIGAVVDGGGTVVAGGGTVVSGGGTVVSGGGTVVSGGGTVVSGGGTVVSGGGTVVVVVVGGGGGVHPVTQNTLCLVSPP